MTAFKGAVNANSLNVAQLKNLEIMGDTIPVQSNRSEIFFFQVMTSCGRGEFTSSQTFWFLTDCIIMLHESKDFNLGCDQLNIPKINR